MVLKLIEKINPKICPGTEHACYAQTRNSFFINSYLSFSSPTRLNPPLAIILPGSYEQDFTDSICLPSFDTITIHSEINSFSETCAIFGTSPATIEQQTKIITMPFVQFLERNNLPPPPVADLHKTITFIDSDIFTHSGIKIINKHCAYGAPCCITCLSMDKRVQHPISLLKLLKAKFEKNDTVFEIAHQAHIHLLQTISEHYTFCYHIHERLLLLNGIIIARGAPAHLIAKVIDASVIREQYSFDNNFFTRDPAIIKTKLDKTFNITIKRASAVFAKYAPLISLERITGKGVIYLHNNYTTQISIQFDPKHSPFG